MSGSSSWTLPGELAGITVLYEFVGEAEEAYLIEVSGGLGWAGLGWASESGQGAVVGLEWSES